MIRQLALALFCLFLCAGASAQTAADAAKLEAERAAAKAAEQTSTPLQRVNPLRSEFLVFQVPGLPLYGSDYHSWYVVRGPLIWTPTGAVDISKIAWPRWDTKQVPPALTYIGPQDGDVVILDGAGEVIERVSLKKSWSPQLYKAPEGRSPERFRIELFSRPERYRLISRNHEWPKQKPLFKCEVEVNDPAAESTKFESSDKLIGSGAAEDDDKKWPPLELSQKVKLCMESLAGVAKNATGGKQWFVDVTWPKPRTRQSQLFIAEKERELRVGLAKNRNVLITRRGTGRHFQAEAGLTQNELLPAVGLDLGGLTKSEWHGETPAKNEVHRKVGDFAMPDGGRVIVNAFPSDNITKRSLDAPSEFNPPINIQFVRAPAVTESEPIHRTDFQEARTGLVGFFRPFWLSISANYHTMSSGRGEEVGSFNGPGLEVNWQSPWYGIEPYFTLDSGVVHYDTTLALSETHFGLRKKILPHLSPSVGFLSYNLRGKNPGSLRLGSMNGISVGASTTLRSEEFIVRGRAHVISSSPFSWDTYAEVSRIIDRGTSDRGLFLGLFVGYTVYRSEALNLVKVPEVFSENRLKFGVTLGIAGPEYLDGF